jgi:hypothetical protein
VLFVVGVVLMIAGLFAGGRCGALSKGGGICRASTDGIGIFRRCAKHTWQLITLGDVVALALHVSGLITIVHVVRQMRGH